MKIVTRSEYAFARWNALDAVQFWFKSVAQWLWQPLLRWAAYVYRHGVPPPAMVFPDSRGDQAQFPPLSSLGFLPSLSVQELWDEGDMERTSVDPSCSYSMRRSLRSRAADAVSPGNDG